MLEYAVIAFAIAALGGLYMATHVLKGKLAPWMVSLLHAGLGAAGLVLTAIAVLEGASDLVVAGLIILIIAALGGFYLASFHLKETIPPRGIVLVHAGAAVIGFGLLLVTVLGIA